MGIDLEIDDAWRVQTQHSLCSSWGTASGLLPSLPSCRPAPALWSRSAHKRTKTSGSTEASSSSDSKPPPASGPPQWLSPLLTTKPLVSALTWGTARPPPAAGAPQTQRGSLGRRGCGFLVVKKCPRAARSPLRTAEDPIWGAPYLPPAPPELHPLFLWCCESELIHLKSHESTRRRAMLMSMARRP